MEGNALLKRQAGQPRRTLASAKDQPSPHRVKVVRRESARQPDLRERNAKKLTARERAQRPHKRHRRDLPRVKGRISAAVFLKKNKKRA